MWSPETEPIEGFEVSKTPRGYTVCRLHYTADPDKRTDEYREAALKRAPNLSAYKREYEIDWSATSGVAFYTLFVYRTAANPDYYAPAEGLKVLQPPVPIFRGFDFGIRKPACVWGQVSASGRVGILREIMPENIDPYSFRDLVRYLSGTLDLKRLEERPRAVEEVLALREKGYKVPFFDGTHTYLDYTSPEALKIRDLDDEGEERNDYEIFREGGITINIFSQRVTAGIYILRKLILPHPDGQGPYLMIDGEHCPLVHETMNGGLTFARSTRSRRLPDTPADDGHLINIHDALRYMVVGMTTLYEFQDGSAFSELLAYQEVGEKRVVPGPGVYIRAGSQDHDEEEEDDVSHWA